MKMSMQLYKTSCPQKKNKKQKIIAMTLFFVSKVIKNINKVPCSMIV